MVDELHELLSCKFTELLEIDIDKLTFGTLKLFVWNMNMYI